LVVNELECGHLKFTFFSVSVNILSHGIGIEYYFLFKVLFRLNSYKNWQHYQLAVQDYVPEKFYLVDGFYLDSNLSRGKLEVLVKQIANVE